MRGGDCKLNIMLTSPFSCHLSARIVEFGFFDLVVSVFSFLWALVEGLLVFAVSSVMYQSHQGQSTAT